MNRFNQLLVKQLFNEALDEEDLASEAIGRDNIEKSKKHKDEAEKKFKRVAELGCPMYSPEAQHILGKINERKKEKLEKQPFKTKEAYHCLIDAQNWHKIAAEKGHILSMVWLGDFYFENMRNNRKIRYKEVVKWYEKFLKNEETWEFCIETAPYVSDLEEARLKVWDRLGFCYYHGLGTDKHPKLAVEYFNKTIEYLNKTNESEKEYSYLKVLALHNLKASNSEPSDKGHGIEKDQKEPSDLWGLRYDEWGKLVLKNYSTGKLEVIAFLRHHHPSGLNFYRSKSRLEVQ